MEEIAADLKLLDENLRYSNNYDNNLTTEKHSSNKKQNKKRWSLILGRRLTIKKSTMDSSSNDGKPTSTGIKNNENQDDDEMEEIAADLKLLDENLRYSNNYDNNLTTEKHSSNKKQNKKRLSLILGRSHRDSFNASIQSTHSTNNNSKAKPRRHSMFDVSRRRSGFLGKQEERSTDNPSTTRDADSENDDDFQRLDRALIDLGWL